MAINRIDQLQRSSTSLPTSEDSQVGQRTRIALNTETTFERGSDSDFDPANFAPAFTPDQRRESNERFAVLSIENQTAVDRAVTRLHESVNAVSAGTGTAAEAGEAFKAALSTYTSALTTTATNLQSTANRSVVRGSGTTGEVTDIMVRVMGRVEDSVAEFAKDLQGKLNIKADLRTTATELGQMISEWPEGTKTQKFTWTSYEVDSDTGRIKSTQHSEDLTKEQAVDLQKQLQAQLDTVSDITQMQQYELQNKYQAQQEAMSTLSEILKSMHDTMKATIANVKAS